MTDGRPMTVLVTGGSGFVGSHLLRQLIGRGHGVIATTTSRFEPPASSEAIRWVQWDATIQPLPEVDWSRVQALCHLACPPAPKDFPGSAPAVHAVTLSATFRLLEAARSGGVERMVLASTGSVLGADRSPAPARESDVLYGPRDFYGTCKACAELLVRYYERELSTAVVRLFHPYGPGGDRFLVNRLVRRVRQGRPITIQGPDGIHLNPVWVEDVARGICLALESAETGVFHLAGPDLLTLRELADLIGEVVERAPVISVSTTPPEECHAGNFERARRLLGYEPGVSLSEGLARLAAAHAEVLA